MKTDFKGKINWVGPNKHFKQGWSMGFVIDTLDGFLNIFADSENELPKLKKGDTVNGTFEKDGEYNVVSVIHTTAAPENKDFIPAANLTNVDDVVSRNVLLMSKILNTVKLSGDPFTPEMIISVYIASHNDLYNVRR